jgi:hypothetical protein
MLLIYGVVWLALVLVWANPAAAAVVLLAGLPLAGIILYASDNSN